MIEAKVIFLRNSQILFIKPFKVAGTSFEICLSTFADKEDIITNIADRDEIKRQALGGLGPQNFRRPGKWPKARHFVRFLQSGLWTPALSQHMSAAHIRENMPTEFDAALKVSIVRNPYEVLVSWYFWRHKSSEKLPDFGDWLRRNNQFLSLNYPFYFIDGAMRVDRFIRYEHMIDDCEALERERPNLAGLSELMKSTRVKNETRPSGISTADLFKPYPDLVEAVRQENAIIMQRFSYNLPSEPKS